MDRTDPAAVLNNLLTEFCDGTNEALIILPSKVTHNMLA